MATITLSYAVGVDYRTADAEVTDAGDIAYVELNGRAFIRCTGGISHNPAEDVIVDDVELALQAMLRFVEGLEA